MNKKTLMVATIVFILFFSVVGIQVAKSASKTITVPDDYPSIQNAVGNASSGDTIFVRKGSYVGGIALNKPITLKGEDAKNTIIVGGSTLENLSTLISIQNMVSKKSTAKYSFTVADTASRFDLQTTALKIEPVNFIPPSTFGVYINSSDVSISGFTIMGGTNAINGNGNRLKIYENILGVVNLGGNNITVANNTRLSLQISGLHNLIADNTGGLLLISSNSTIIKNLLSDFELQNANSNNIINNTLTGANMGLYIGARITSGPTKCSYNLFAGNRMERCGLWGILMGEGTYNVFFGNIVENTGIGIGHDGYGLALGGNHLIAEDNLFLGNIFVNNTRNFGTNWIVNGDNFFDDGKTGNYWDDYLTRYPNAKEVGQSGTGNTPYVLVGANVDNHPLLNQPNVSDKVPTLPEPWTSLLSNAKAPSIPEFSSWLILPLFVTITLLISIIYFRKNKR